MFYAPEILSRKSKTELSLVYYLSTSTNIKRGYRKEIIELDVASVIEKMQNPKIPFALRLYSYLLYGIVKIWRIKVEHYKGQVKSMLVVRRKPTKHEKLPPESNVNLRIVNNFITEVEDISSTLNNFFTQPNQIEPIPEPQLGISSGFDDIEFNLTEVTKQKKTVVNRITELEVADLYVKRHKHAEYIFPCLINCTVVSKYSDWLLAPKDPRQEEEQRVFDDDISFEEPRISSSSSLERVAAKPCSSENEEALFRLVEQRITSFYKILIAATNGEIEVQQEQAFGTIKIKTNTETIYFD